MKKSLQKWFMVFSIAFLIALFITTMIATVGMGGDAVPAQELLYDLILALFIACVQMIWIGADRSNKTYIARSILHFAVLLGGCTVLMLLFGWLPPLGWPIISYYVIFVAAYAVIWIAAYRRNEKLHKKMNEKLEEYKANGR